jgi:glycosyltransferase involved in cell wall biosynthesis
MKVLYVNPSSHLGGAERSLLDVICASRSQDSSIEITVLITAGDGPLVTELAALGVKVILLELPRSIARLGDSDLSANGNKLVALLSLIGKLSVLADLGRYWQKLRQAVTQISPDLVHSNGLKTHLLIASLGLNRPIIWHLRDFVGSRLLIKQLLKLFVSRATVAIAISQAIADDWQSVFPQLPIQVVYNAIDIDKYRAIPQVRSDELKIGLVATYALWKGHDVFIDAIGRIAQYRPEQQSTVKFYIIGGAIYETARSQHSRDRLQQLAHTHQVGDWLTFIDFQQDIVASYNMLDIVVHASTQPEPFGRTIVEAMACEKAVIVANAGGAAELFNDGGDGIGVPPGDAEALATAIQNLIDAPAKRIAIGKAGRVTATTRFNRARLGAEIISIYHQIDRSK